MQATQATRTALKQAAMMSPLLERDRVPQRGEVAVRERVPHPPVAIQEHAEVARQVLPHVRQLCSQKHGRLVDVDANYERHTLA